MLKGEADPMHDDPVFGTAHLSIIINPGRSFEDCEGPNESELKILKMS